MFQIVIRFRDSWSIRPTV